MEYGNQGESPVMQSVPPIGKEQVKKFLAILQEYKSGKTHTERRIISSENWWKLRNHMEEEHDGASKDKGFKSQSGWLHNVITTKHADAIEAYPEPNILPREEADKDEAKKLTAIIPLVLEHNKFEGTYSDVAWQKLKTGTGVYKIVWDQSKLNGLGDISIERVNLLNVYWEPGITDIQKSRYFFHVELVDKDLLVEQYPQLEGKLKTSGITSAEFLYDDAVKTDHKAAVVDVYYHKMVNGRKVLHLCKFVEEEVLFATENETQPEVDEQGQVIKDAMAVTGLYDHAKYPYEFDALFPIEGSPCGYGYVDLCRNPQTVIDILNTAFIKNARVGAVPRYFSRIDGNVNEDEFLDLEKTLVKVSGNVDEATLRKIDPNNLDGNYIAMLDRIIEELRQTTGNTEASAGTAPSGVTTASGIAALQEASGKTSRDSTLSAYRSFSNITDTVIELIRQFYDLPRQFRITGQYGMEEFVSYTNAGLKPQDQGNQLGVDMGYRLPVFDIKISAQKKNAYTKMSQNELALQFFQLGFFNPQMADQALLCLEMMDFDGKDQIMQRIAQNGTLMQKLIQYMQMALTFAPPEYQQMIAQDMMALTGTMPQMPAPAQMPQGDSLGGGEKKEHGVVRNARAQSQNAAQPDAGAVKE